MADHDAPQSANEAILQNILGETNPIREPQSRIEELLIELLEQLEEMEIGGIALPTTDGDYKLHVENGVATWVSMSALEVQDE